MKIECSENKIIIKNPKEFSLKDTFDCGQCFRFHETEDGSYEGVAFSRPARFREEADRIVISGPSREEFLENWYDFLDLGRDYGQIKKSLSKDKTLGKAIEYGGGIRILKQEFFECTLSFIISQQNNIPKIKKAVEGFCQSFGEMVSWEGKPYFTFPRPAAVSNLTEKDLAHLKLGYREKYLIDAIRRIHEGGLCGETLSALPYEEAKKALLAIKGVGEKVANCILLFSLGKFEAFPVDTWVKKAMEELYCLKEPEIQDYCSKAFGAYSGFAQQYIFYYIRSKKVS